jgi:TatA/E family protein of Tat protein translocase
LIVETFGLLGYYVLSQSIALGSPTSRRETYLFGIGGAEIFIVLLFGFLIFGPDQMPKIARTIGRAIRQFRNAQEQMSNVIKSEVYDPLKDLEPLANPFDGFSLEGGKEAAKKPAAKKPAAKKPAAKPAETDAKAKADEAAAKAPAKKTTVKVSRQDVADDLEPAAAATAATAAAAAKPADAAKPANQDNFAARRARLEKELAARKAAAAQAEPADDGKEAGE